MPSTVPNINEPLVQAGPTPDIASRNITPRWWKWLSDIGSGILTFAITAAEIAAGITPTQFEYNPWIYDVRRVGVVPNDPTAGTANYLALRTLFNPANVGPTGIFIFPNTTGADIYYIGAAGQTCVIPMRDGCHIDLCYSTLQFTGKGSAALDSNSGMFFALHDLVIENGKIIVNYDVFDSVGSGAVVFMGARPTGSSYFQVTDSLLPVPLGGLRLANLRTQSNLTTSAGGKTLVGQGACGIGLLGGIQGLVMQNVYMNGNGTLPQFVSYEFGFATTVQPVQSSHMRQATFNNVYLHNGENVSGLSYGIILTGVYNITIDGLYCNGISSPVSIGPGEAMNFLPWSSVDTVGAKHNLKLSNLVLQGFSNIGIQIAGSQLVAQASGYHAWYPSTAVALNQIVVNGPNMYQCTSQGTTAASGGPTGTGAVIIDNTVVWAWYPSAYPAAGGAANSAWPNETDLYDVTFENITIDGGGGSSTYGINVTGCRQVVGKNISINNCLRGVVTDDETVSQTFDGIVILNSKQSGMSLGAIGAIWSPARAKKIEVKNAYIAGSGTSSPGSFFAISMGGTVDSALIENCRFGYTVQHAGFNDTTQAGAIFLAGTITNVICIANNCAPPVGGGNASYYSTLSGSNGCTIQNATGDTSTHGAWEGIPQLATVALTCATPGNLAVTYSNATLEYIKTGNKVDYILRLESNTFSWTTASGAVSIIGLPYTVNSSYGIPIGALLYGGITKPGFTQINVLPLPGTTTMLMQASASGVALTTVTIADMPSGGAFVLRASGSYFV